MPVASRSAAWHIAASVAAGSPGAGASSTTFWWRRWTEQSRVPSAAVVSSPDTICTSTWRPASTYGSTKTVPSPNALSASAPAASISACSRSRVRTTRMPRPPPPAEAFTISGRSASVGSEGVESTGTPALSAISLARTLSPIDAIASGGGPIQVRPASMTARAKSAFSDRKP